MSEKFFSPEEVARRVLSKVLETYNNRDLAKANTSHEIHPGEEPFVDGAECPEHLSHEGKKKSKKTKQHGNSEPEEGESEEHEESETPEQEHEEHESEEYEEDEHESPEHEENESEEEESEEHKEKKKFPFQKSEKGIDLLKNFLGKREDLAKKEKDILAPKKKENKIREELASNAEEIGEEPVKEGKKLDKSSDEHRENVEVGQRGVHTTFGQKKGVSTRGAKIRAAKEDPSDAKNLIPSAKSNDKFVMQEQKKIKPNLPKSECPMDSDKVLAKDKK